MIALKITIEKLKYARSSSIIEIFKDKIIDTLKYWLFENCIVSNFYFLDFGFGYFYDSWNLNN